MIEERQRTLAEIALIEASDAKKQEVIAALIAVHEAVNNHLAKQAATFDARIIPAALAGLSTELGRVYTRMADEGLAPGSPQLN